MDYEWKGDQFRVIATDKEMTRFRKWDKANTWGWIDTQGSMREMLSSLVKFRWLWSEPHITGDLTGAPIIAAIDDPVYSKDLDYTDQDSMTNSCMIYAGSRTQLGNTCHFYHPIRARWAHANYQIESVQKELLRTGSCLFVGDSYRPNVLVSRQGEKATSIKCKLFYYGQQWMLVGRTQSAYAVLKELTGRDPGSDIYGMPRISLSDGIGDSIQGAVNQLTSMARQAELAWDIQQSSGLRSAIVTFRAIDRMSTLTRSHSFHGQRFWPSITNWEGQGGQHDVAVNTVQKMRMAFSGRDNPVRIETRTSLTTSHNHPHSKIIIDKGRVHGFFVDYFGTANQIARQYDVSYTKQFEEQLPLTQIRGAHYGVPVSIDIIGRSFDSVMDQIYDKERELEAKVRQVRINELEPFIARIRASQAVVKPSKNVNRPVGFSFNRLIDIG